MEYLLVIIAAPLAAWVLDRILYRGELAEAFLETINSSKAARRRADRPRRPPTADRIV
jgi:hypothetical protein